MIRHEEGILHYEDGEAPEQVAHREVVDGHPWKCSRLGYMGLRATSLEEYVPAHGGKVAVHDF